MLQACSLPASPASHVAPQTPPWQVDISDVEQFEALRQQEQQYFRDMVQQCKDSGATLVICQWGEAPVVGVGGWGVAWVCGRGEGAQ